MSVRRTQFTFTFTNAQPGSDVHFSAPVYADASTATADGPTLVLDSSNAVSVWADAGFLIATTEDGNGQPLSATATATNASVTTGSDQGAAGHNPFGGGASTPPRQIWVGFLGTGPVGGAVHFDKDPDTGTGDNINWGTALPDGLFVDPDDPTKLHLPVDTLCVLSFDFEVGVDPGATFSNQRFPTLSMGGSVAAGAPAQVQALKAGWDVDAATQSAQYVGFHGNSIVWIPSAYAPDPATDATLTINAQHFTTADPFDWTWSGAGMVVTLIPGGSPPL